MIDLIRCRGRGSRFAALTLAAFTLFALVLVATPASAHPNPPAGFHPDETSNTSSISSILTDRADGRGETAHLTTVMPNNIDRADFLVCPEGAGGVDDVYTQVELTACNISAGSDSTGVTPTAGTTFVPADEAYEVFWDIPTGLDTAHRDILILGCVGAGQDVEGAGQNCIQTLEEHTRLDDAAGGTTGQTTAGEHTGTAAICTADTDGPGAGLDPCNVAATVQGSPERAVIDARFKPFNHGDRFPTTGAVFRGTTSPDVPTASPPFLSVDNGADANLDINALDYEDSCIQIETFTTHKTWECDLTGGQVPNGTTELGMWFQEAQAVVGEGFCTGQADGPSTDGVWAGGPAAADCTFSATYHASIDRVAAKAIKSFSPTPPDPPANAGCQVGETPDKDHSTTNLASTPDEEGCLVDDFNDPFMGPFTVESTGVGELDCAAFTEHDHDGDGVTDHCHGNTAALTGLATWEVENTEAVPGDQTITFCHDPENAGTGTDHGCSNTTIKDSNVMHWGTTATQVFLVYSGTGTAGDPCRTGQTQRVNRVGQRDGLTACTFDTASNPVATDPAGSSGGRLIWEIQATRSGENVGVRFPSPPDQDTHAPNGQTTTTIEAFDPSSTFICITLVNVNGNYVDGGCPGDQPNPVFVEKRVEPVGRADCPPPYKKKNGNKKNNKLKGTATCDKIRGKAGNDVLRGKGEDDLLIGGRGFDRCFGGPGRDRFRGCEIKKQGRRR